MEKGTVVFIAILFLVIGLVISNWYIKANNVCYNLPKHGSTDQWGPFYWEAFHDLSARIPCQECREKGSEFICFMHDSVNLKLKKPLKNEQNFEKWLTIFSEMKKKRDEAISK